MYDWLAGQLQVVDGSILVRDLVSMMYGFDGFVYIPQWLYHDACDNVRHLNKQPTSSMKFYTILHVVMETISFTFGLTITLWTKVLTQPHDPPQASAFVRFWTLNPFSLPTWTI